VGNGWWGSYGDALARILARAGYEVSREYYVNDTGGQIRTLGESLLARRSGRGVPEGGYAGDYVTELAATYDGPEDVAVAGRWAAEHILDHIRATLASVGIVFDEWYSQASIEESGAVDETIALLAEAGLVFEQDGATWFRATDLGDSRDRVLRKSNGDATYLAGDLAYHRDKFLVRGFDRVIDVFGADHHGQVASLMAGVQALGIDPSRLEVKLGQMVSLMDGDEAVKMGKRAGNAVSLDSLVADIGPDATRILSLMSSLDQATTFDLASVREQSVENPVFYVQMASARIGGVGRKAIERGVVREPLTQVDLALLVHSRETELIRCLEELPEVVADAASDRAPTKVTTWVRRLAGCFHGFYHDCPILADDVDPAVTQARLWLVDATRIGLAIGLGLLGVSAPEAM
jgi:arginyl-tRNA synthetase